MSQMKSPISRPNNVGLSCCCCSDAYLSESSDNDTKYSCKIERDFVSKTTCHGISYWCESTHCLQRIFWILFVLGVTGGMFFQVYSRILDYFDYKASTDTSREFKSEIEFPAVTFCNYNRYFFPDSKEELHAMHLLSTITSPLFLAYAHTHSLPIDRDAYGFFHAKVNFTTSGYLFKKGYHLNNNTLRFCRFRSSICSAEDFHPVITRLGKCYTFNRNESIKRVQSVAGASQGLQITLNVLHEDYTEEAFYGNQEAGIKFQVHSKYEAPNVEKYGVAVPVGHKAFAVVSRKDSEILHHPWGQCRPNEQRKLKYFSTYTINSCMKECYTESLVDKCKCRSYDQYWAWDHPECDLRQMEACATSYTIVMENKFTPQSCKCTMPCSFTEFTTIPSYATAPGLQTRRFYEKSLGYTNNSRYVQENFVSLDITFAEIGFTKETQSKQIDEIGLMSDIGGQLGLWVGMSFVTVAEFIQYFITRVVSWCKFSQKKRKRRKKYRMGRSAIAEKTKNEERERTFDTILHGETVKGSDVITLQT
ncbi:bile acid-sensitive ion channel-like isoform X1 [Clavelina lepadiformis]|uniref:bile acid-sensitive ion channel-like isoform X1 n=1 Tax=Clavelina lepadiformis TaxID=159417 RepID=UPI00404200BF